MTNVNENNSVIDIEEQIQEIDLELNDALPLIFDVLPNLPTISLLSNNTLDIPRISFSELITVTDNWNQEMVLGRGMFGCVFKGTWQDSSIAVKSYALKNVNHLLTEILCLKVYHHINIIPLVAYHYGSTPKAHLVYEWIPGGSLTKRMKTKEGEEVLSWYQRVKIAVGIARAIHYLHSALARPLVHGDVKAANILLRTDEEAVLGDFGTAYECSHVNTCEKIKGKCQGTFAYLPPEYLRKKHISTKLDVYSFGVVLLQLATGSGVRLDKDKSPKDVYTVKDFRLEGGQIYFNWLLHLGQDCVQELPKARPDMAVVLQRLETIDLVVD